MKYIIAFLVCGMFGVLWLASYAWVDANYQELPAPQPPGLPIPSTRSTPSAEEKSKQSPENQFASLSKEQLLDLTKDMLSDLGSVASTWKFKIDDTNDQIHTRMRGAYKDDGHGHSRRWTEEEIAEYKRPLERDLEEAGHEIRVSAGHTVPRLCDLHAELVYRLDFWRKKLVPPEELGRALFDKLRTENYKYEDLEKALKYVADIKNAYEQRDPNLLPR